MTEKKIGSTAIFCFVFCFFCIVSSIFFWMSFLNDSINKRKKTEEPKIEVADTVKAKPGRLLKISATTNCKTIKWFSASEDADLIASESGLWAIFCASKPGSYRVFLYSAKGDDPTDPKLCTVLVEGEKPTPTPPQPDPLPEPANVLEQQLKPLYAADGSKDKQSNTAMLADVYFKMAIAAKDEKILTVKDLYEYGRRLSLQTIPTEAINPIRDTVGSYLDKKLPLDTQQQLTAESRSLCSSEFSFVSTTLQKLVKP